MIRSVCSYTGCHHIALNGTSRCEEHTAEYKRPDTKKKKRDRAYGTARWKKLRAMKLKQSPLCSNCRKVANTVHHIVPVKEGGDFWDLENLDTLCRSCHENEHGNRFLQETTEQRNKRTNKWKGFLNEEK